MEKQFDFGNPQFRKYAIAAAVSIVLAVGAHYLLSLYFPEHEPQAFRAASLFVLAMSSGFLLMKNMLVLTASRRFAGMEKALRRTIPLSFASLVILYLTDFDNINISGNSPLQFLASGVVRRYVYLALAALAAFLGDRIYSIEGETFPPEMRSSDQVNRPAKAYASVGTVISCIMMMALAFEYFVLPAGLAPNPIAGVNIIITGFLSALAMAFMIGMRTKNLADATEIVGMGKLIFGFSIFWAYINFSEILISTYSLSAEGAYGEIAGYENYGRIYVSFLLCFAIPFVLLLARRAKSNTLLLRLSSVAIIHGSYITILRYFDISLNLTASLAIFAMTGWWALFWIGDKMRSSQIS